MHFSTTEWYLFLFLYPIALVVGWGLGWLIGEFLFEWLPSLISYWLRKLRGES